jgi:hypothetical protein
MSKPEDDPRALSDYLYDIASVGVVEYSNCEFGIKMYNDSLNSIHCGKYGFIQVIGNVFDNPEFL